MSPMPGTPQIPPSSSVELVSPVSWASVDSPVLFVAAESPTDDAFAQLSTQRMADLRDPSNRDRLRSLLLTHVVKGQMSEEELSQLP